MPHFRRLILLLVVLVAVAAGALAWQLASRVSTERLQDTVRARVSELVGEPVRIGSVGLALRGGLAIEATDLRTLDDPDAPALEAEHATLVLALRGLLFGSIEIRRIELDGVRARIVPGPEGRWRPALAAGLLERAARAPDTPAPTLAQRVADAARLVLRVPPALPSVSVDDAEVTWAPAAPEDGEPALPAALAIRNVQLRLGRRPFGSGIALRAHADVGAQGIAPGRVSIAGTLPRRGGAELAIELDGIDLALLGRVPALHTDPLTRLAGRASGAVSWEMAPPEHHEVNARLDLSDAEAWVAGDGEPVRLATAKAELAAELVADPERLDLERLRLASGALAAELGLAIDLPPRDDSRVDLSLSVKDLPLIAARDAWRAASAAAPPAVLARAESGRVAELHARARNVRLGRLRKLSGDPLAAWPDSAALDATLADAAWRVADGRRLAAVSGRLARSADRVTVSGLTGRLDRQTLPRLDLVVDGVPWLARAKRSERADPAPGLPGIAALDRWHKSRRKPGQPPSWIRAELTAPWIDHPALLWPLTQVRAAFEPIPDDGGNRVNIESALWGGVPMRAAGIVGGAAPGRVALTIELGREGGKTPPPSTGTPPGQGPWGRAQLDLHVHRLGGLPADRLRASLETTGTTLRGANVRIDVRPAGEARGTVTLELGQPDSVPFDAALALRGAPLGAVAAAVGASKEVGTGRSDVDARLGGRLRAGRPLLEGANGAATLRARDGEIRRRLPALLALATASNTFNPFAERETIPYRELDADLRVENGLVHIESLRLDGPAVRLVAEGTLDPLAPGRPIDLEMGVFLFPNVDWVIGNVPLVNRVVLGKDRNLVSGYFHVTGPWDAPKATLIPTKSLSAGPGSMVLEAVPDAVRAGMGQIQRWMGGERPDAEPPDGADGSESPAPEEAR